jgi:gliding motility associated protien GldN
MMNVKNIFIVFFSIGCGSFFYGQSNLLNAKSPSQIGLKTKAQLNSDNDKPLAYGYVDDRDILMSRTTWEIIDLGEKINFPLYFPTDTLNVAPDRRSLFNTLINAIKKNKINEVYTDGYFTTKKTINDINSMLERTYLSPKGIEEYNQSYKKKFTKINTAELTPSDVKDLIGAGFDKELILTEKIEIGDIIQYKIKGVWYFDKRQSELKYRLLGICPVISKKALVISSESEQSEGGDTQPSTKNTDDEYFNLDLFWVFFPNARETLYAAKAFNEKNSSMPISFDQLLNARRFNSVIYKEENVYGDREIKDYLANNALNQLLESDRIKDKIRSFEQDMWSY